MFFVILNQNQANRLLRIHVDNEAQQRMEEIFSECIELFSYSEAIPFSADSMLSSTEIFYIDNFNSGFELSLLRDNPEAVTELQLGINAELSDIVGVCMIRGKTIYIQSFNKRNLFDLSRSFFSQKNQFVVANQNGITLDNRLVAILTENNTLKFRSLNAMRHIFDMDRYFREATNQEINDFISTSSHFECDSNMNIESIADTVIRTKITVINNSQVLQNHTIEELKIAAINTNFTLPLNTTQDKIYIPNDKKRLKDLLHFLSSNIYKDQITGQTRIAQSSRIYTQ